MKPRAEVAGALADYVSALRPAQLSPHTIDIALCCILDLLGAAAAALDNPGVQAARRAAVPLYGAGPVAIWFTGATGSSSAALLANSTAAAALDLDDGYRRARGHPGAAVMPAVLAGLSTAASRPRTADELIAAVVAAYEVGVRMAMGRLSYAPSGAWSPYAVIAATAHLEGISAEVITQAFGIAAQTAPALPALAGLVGSDVKEGIPAGVVAGHAALRLAQAGFTGPAAVLDDRRLFAGDAILDGLGGVPLIEGSYFKPFGCCRHIHGALDALLQLQAEHGVAREDIAAIAVHTYRATFNLANRAAPQDLVDAQYSVPHCLAVCARHGADALLPLQAAHLADPAVNALARRITVHYDAAIGPLFPARSPSRITITLSTGQRLQSAQVDPRGDPGNPMSWDQLKSKFLTATAGRLSPDHQAAVIEGVAQLRSGDVTPLRLALARPGLVA
jgi:2-methylcitrate dehydratase PrpD